MLQCSLLLHSLQRTECNAYLIGSLCSTPHPFRVTDIVKVTSCPGATAHPPLLVGLRCKREDSYYYNSDSKVMRILEASFSFTHQGLAKITSNLLLCVRF